MAHQTVKRVSSARDGCALARLHCARDLATAERMDERGEFESLPATERFRVSNVVKRSNAVERMA